jgi:hypothetical protein
MERIDQLLATENPDPKLEKIRLRVIKLQKKNEKMRTNPRKTYTTELEKRVMRENARRLIRTEFLDVLSPKESK